MNQGIFPSKKALDLEEERRLFYVNVTRAKEKLFLSRSHKMITWGTKEEIALESQFIKELDL